MNNINYVTKKETKPYKTEFNQLFQKIKKYFMDDFSLSYQLVGSSLKIKKNEKIQKKLKINFLNSSKTNGKKNIKLKIQLQQ
ncbi:MAG: hypothetical protein ACRC8P_00900 [Spiroplasma sp.]